MKAVVWHGVGDIRLDEVPDPTVRDPFDAVVRITTSAICGTDLHFVRGTMSGMREGTVLGHEAVGIVEEVGPGVRNLAPGDRVVVPSTVACGSCSYCRAGYYSQCDVANPGGKTAGTVFFGGPEAAGGLDGMQAEFVRVPFAHVGLVRVPEAVTDDQAIMVSDVFPTAWFGAKLAEVGDGDTVAVFGAGPVGLFAVLSAFRQGAGRVLVVDGHPDRLDAARRLGAETVDFNAEDPVTVLRDLTGGAGPDRVIDAVGVDAERPKEGPAAEASAQSAEQFAAEVAGNAPETNEQDGTWRPGDAPSQAAQWYVQAVAKAGTVGIIGVYPPTMSSFPLGQAMNKNLVLKMGNCEHRRYVPQLLDLVAAGVVDPATVITQHAPVAQDALDAYRHFDRREAGWVKTVLDGAR
ncbi:alcohol dehydrogenase catalytic domain-containing protein [Kineococcus sp. R8]|uniref:alcohol dehydrogenase catalytic domain-containing protein n=1 Tax=Kineococcus siccus TaxID=2696567 RepID=UPI001411B7DE|nr:alcohol dehydrogenase catalytic domain-containing protein [Kineococcus siccus]